MFRNACWSGLLRATVALSILFTSIDARAGGVSVRPEISLRTGYGVALGGNDRGDLADTVAGQVPLWVDAGARIDERFFVGAYAQYSFSILGDAHEQACRDEDRYVAQFGGSVSCEVHGSRLGLELLFHARPGSRLDPWVGLGAGYEWLTSTETTTGANNGSITAPKNQTIGITWQGFEFLNLQFGLDIHLIGPLAVGPFVMMTVAHYRRADGLCRGDCDTTTVVAHAPEGDSHTWLYGGARTTLVF